MGKWKRWKKTVGHWSIFGWNFSALLLLITCYSSSQCQNMPMSKRMAKLYIKFYKHLIIRSFSRLENKKLKTVRPVQRLYPRIIKAVWELEDRLLKQQQKAYLWLPLYETVKIILQRWQILQALMSPLQVHCT